MCQHIFLYLLQRNLHEISRIASASQVARPSAAKTFRLGFLPTASRLEALLTRNASRKRMRGCVTCTTNDGPVGSAIYRTHTVSMLSLVFT